MESLKIQKIKFLKMNKDKNKDKTKDKNKDKDNKLLFFAYINIKNKRKKIEVR